MRIKALVTGAGAAAIMVGLAGGMAMAADGPKPEDAVKYRRGVMQVIKNNFGPIAAVAKGDAPFNDSVATRAATLVVVAKLALEGFVPGSDKAGDTKAKPVVWTKWDDFKGAATTLDGELAKLADIAKTGDAAALKAQVGAVGKACKGCHETFKED